MLLVSGAFFSLHLAVTGKLSRTSVDEPWLALIASLEHDPFVLAGLVGTAASSAAHDAAAQPRELDPDPRVLAWVVQPLTLVV